MPRRVQRAASLAVPGRLRLPALAPHRAPPPPPPSQADADVRALFETPEVRAAVAAKAGAAVETLVVESFKTQVVAGLKYQVTVSVNGAPSSHVIHAFKPLPHTGAPLEVQDVTAA
jgi:hypothetical protein